VSQLNGNQFFPFLGAFNLVADTDTKLSHDRYEVYVNGDFIGYKTLLTQSEALDDIHFFLHEHGFQQFQAHQEGDHYEIETDASSDKLKQTLQFYLQNR
jgi:hypothetical protein